MQTPDAENVAPQVPPHPCDRLGHGCDYCRAVRRLGPREPQNPLARLIPPSASEYLTPSEVRAKDRAARYVQRRKREHARTQVSQLASTYSSYRALLAAVLKAA